VGVKPVSSRVTANTLPNYQVGKNITTDYLYFHGLYFEEIHSKKLVFCNQNKVLFLYFV
jgi:hypothetical protein